MQAYRLQLTDLGCSDSDFARAFSMVHSRNFTLHLGGTLHHVVVPGIDMANHSFEPTAHVR